MVAAASLYTWPDGSLPAWTLANEEASSWWTRRRSRRSLTTPLAIQALHTCRREGGGQRSANKNVWLPGLVLTGHLAGLGGDVRRSVGGEGGSESSSHLKTESRLDTVLPSDGTLKTPLTLAWYCSRIT